MTPSRLSLAVERVSALLDVLERMAAGDLDARLPLSDRHDELDAIAHGINVLAGELRYATTQALASQQARESELREALAAAERANASKNVFLRNVSHEIRTPIAAMIGIADLLGSDVASAADRSELIHRLQANGRAVLTLLGDLLDLARLDANRLVLAPESISVFDLVREVLASVEPETRRKGIDVRVELHDALSAVRTDRMRLRQILVNLVTNAVKFTDGGRIVVSIRADHAEDRWTVDIIDTGIGIPRDRHEQLFKPFEQADPLVSGTYGGIGLGLALSRRLAEQLGGTVALVKSDPGVGSTFRLTFRALADAPTETTIEALDPGEGVRDLRILLAEDHRDIRAAVGRLLEHEGAIVSCVEDGADAVAAGLRAEPAFDVILMDMRMPRMNGLDATRALRRGGVATRIIALTADATDAGRRDALAAGCDACLAKPFTLKDLVAVIGSQRPIRAATQPPATA